MPKNSQLMKQLSKALPRGSEGKEVPGGAVEMGGPVRSLAATKLSVSLYEPDLEKLDMIKAFMQGKGFRNISDSEALRLACRSTNVGDEMIPLYQDMQQED